MPGRADHGRVQGLPEAAVHGVGDAHHLALEMADEQLPAAAAALLRADGADATQLQVQGDPQHGRGAAARRSAGLRSSSDDEQGDGDGKDPALHLQHGPKLLQQHPHHRDQELQITLCGVIME